MNESRYTDACNICNLGKGYQDRRKELRRTWKEIVSLDKLCIYRRIIFISKRNATQLLTHKIPRSYLVEEKEIV